MSKVTRSIITYRWWGVWRWYRATTTATTTTIRLARWTGAKCKTNNQQPKIELLWDGKERKHKQTQAERASESLEERVGAAVKPTVERARARRHIGQENKKLLMLCIADSRMCNLEWNYLKVEAREKREHSRANDDGGEEHLREWEREKERVEFWTTRENEEWGQPASNRTAAAKWSENEWHTNEREREREREINYFI